VNRRASSHHVRRHDRCIRESHKRFKEQEDECIGKVMTQSIVIGVEDCSQRREENDGLYIALNYLTRA